MSQKNKDQDEHQNQDDELISHASWKKRFLIWGGRTSSIACLTWLVPGLFLDTLPPRAKTTGNAEGPSGLCHFLSFLATLWHSDDIKPQHSNLMQKERTLTCRLRIRSFYWSTQPTRSLAPSAIKLAVSKLDPSSTICHGTKISAQSSVLPPAAETQLLELQNQSLCSPLSRDSDRPAASHNAQCF